MEKINSDSAQAIIIGGFLIAIGMIAVATVINGMIFSQNIDARGVEVDDQSISSVTESTVDETEYIMHRVQYLNKSGSFGFTPEPATDYYDKSMKNYTKSLQPLPSNQAVSLSVNTSGTTYDYFATVGSDGLDNRQAWQFLQNDSTRPMVDDTGTATWQMTNPSSTDGLEQFFMMNFVMELTASDPVTIQVNDTANNPLWNMSYSPAGTAVPAPISPPGLNDYIAVCDSTVSPPNCQTYESTGISGFDNGDPVKIEVFEGNGEINDTSASVNLLARDAGLDGSLNGPYEVIIKNGDRAEAVYEIRGPDAAFDAPNSAPGLCGSQPCQKSNRRVAGVVHKVGYNYTYTDTQSSHVARVEETLPPQVVP